MKGNILELLENVEINKAFMSLRAKCLGACENLINSLYMFRVWVVWVLSCFIGKLLHLPQCEWFEWISPFCTL